MEMFSYTIKQQTNGGNCSTDVLEFYLLLMQLLGNVSTFKSMPFAPAGSFTVNCLDLEVC
jgi:hypothetical protein